jgi:putative ABC transport system permease protein
MLELKQIVKDYIVGDRKFRAVNKIDLTLNKGEFVAILGPSGCGKTTTLNIIGGLDRYTSGDLIINGTSTKQFKERDWDAYRNNSIGFVFQSYNLINHLSVIDNVELGMTLSGIGPEERRKRSLEVLERVGLTTQIEKKPTKLSGGEKQRVAIARALLNDPDIILADEPTGALDSKTANEILTLIQEISKEKLVIMVTHTRQYADDFASRLIELKDGEIISDTGNTVAQVKQDGYVPKKTAMSFWTALKLSFNNLRTKKFRTTITALASSIGIIGVGLVLSISNGFSAQLEDVETEQLVGLPILIGRQEMEIGFDRAGATTVDVEGYDEDQFVIYDPSQDVHNNLLTQDFIDHLETLDPEVYTNIQYEYGYVPTLLTENYQDEIELIEINELGFSSFITPTNEIPDYYSLKAGKYPESPYEVVLLVDEWNVVNIDIIASLGYDVGEELYYEDVLGKELFIALNDDLYVEQTNVFVPNFPDLETVKDNGITVSIVGILQSNDNTIDFSGDGIKYLYGLKEELLVENSNSTICQVQDSQETSVFDLANLTDQEKEMLLAYLGCNTTEPFLIQIYTDSVEHKEIIKQHIAEYNEGKNVEYMIFETDLAEAIGETLGTLITSVSVVLTAFASISLVVSSVMIGVIIYISVLERTKEIGIIRSLGGRKKDISRVFNAESMIIGAFAGLLGVFITFLLTFPINVLAENYDESLANVASVNILHLIALVIISTVLTFIGGFIPSRIASRKNPVEALRVE